MSISTLRLCAPLAALAVGCSAPSEFRELPDDHVPPPDPIIQARIAAFEAATPEGRPYSIQRVLYNGNRAYLIASPCCDQFNYLYDAQGLRLCAPSGGIAGKGDGKCTGAIAIEGAVRVTVPAASVPQ